ncbi:MAG: thioredoxin domain-containing protein [Chloroflexaceae bacterium]|nr:thioredoxin domain-containing protein [Chloroflexaceae bacterium]NJO05955.1 thioredoxin domain-containing protein [Chloroflexaceae bacterium]
MLAIEPQLVDRYVRQGIVRLSFRPVLNHGVRSLRTSEAVVCAGRQDQFWAMHDLLFARLDASWQTPESNLAALMTDYAAELGMDAEAFRACMASGEALAQVQALDAEQRTRGIVAQPTFELNAVRLVGFQSFERFQGVIEQLQTGQ